MSDLSPCSEDTIPNHIQEMQDELIDLLSGFCDMPEMINSELVVANERTIPAQAIELKGD